jgi:diadenosine tetraphosphatase ApaH/serine/threonine PP2A family protein phosphatase
MSRILIISDVHANLVALDTVFGEVGAVDEIWSVGDIIGYGPRPQECLERVRAVAPRVSVPGNHDWACIGRISTVDFNPVAKFAASWTAEQLNADDVRYLDALPERMLDHEWTIVHGSPRDPIWEYVVNWRIAAENFRYFDTRLCLMGHTHVQGYFRDVEMTVGLRPFHPRDGEVLDVSAGRFMVNPGSVGQPRDGDPRAACAIFEPEQGTVTFRRIPYAVHETQAQMAAEGLPDTLIARVARGV